MKLRVLFLAANPQNLTQLALEKEVEKIREKIQASDFGDDFEIVPHFRTKADDLLQLFNQDDDWDIVHYSGHGSANHEILLEDENGQAKAVSKDALRRLFGTIARKARVVIFNACYAEGQAEAVSEHIGCTIGMSKPVGDRAAILFAASFYRGIGFGKSVKQAFEQGLQAIDLEGIKETETPQLRHRQDVDPHMVYLLTGKHYEVDDEWTRLAPAAPTPADGQKWHAFLSYRSVNRPWVLNLHDVLQRHGYNLFLDQFALQPGMNLEQRLNEGLQQSRTGVLIWSEANADSEWCMKELETMRERRKQGDFSFVTLLIGGDIPAALDEDVWIDFRGHPRGPNGGGLLRLLFTLSEQPMTPQAVTFATEQDQEGKEAENKIEAAIKNGKPENIVALFETGGVPWNSSAGLGCRAAEGLTKLGAYDEALAMLAQVQERFPRSVRPKQLLALVLARCAAQKDLDPALQDQYLDQAQETLAMLRADGHEDPETLGIYARTWMDRHRKSGKKIDLKKSRKLYADAFEHAPDDTYPGINAAAKSVFLGEVDRGREYAQRVVEALPDPKHWDYWQRATHAEAHLILGDFAKAVDEYENAVLDASEEKGSLASTKTQALALCDQLEVSADVRSSIEGAFEGV